MTALEQIKENEKHLDAFRGCLIGGAAGDALGYAVEFLQLEQIKQKYGEGGICAYDCGNGKVARISDDTQMTLFTATALLTGTTRGMLRGVFGSYPEYCGFAYKSWYKLQRGTLNTDGKRHDVYSWLCDVPAMGESRAPGFTCMSVIESSLEGGRYGTMNAPINNSKGCGGIMRVAPIGLYLNRQAERNSWMDDLALVAAENAALTHGHELGYMPAAAFAHIINWITFGGMSIEEAVRDSMAYMRDLFADKEQLPAMLALMEKALRLAKNQKPDTDNIRELGEGWVAEETLAIAIYCAVKYAGDFSAAIIAAVNHSGDSDSTGAVTGNIVGAALGYDAIPQQWKSQLECHDVIMEVAKDLCDDCQMSEYGEYRDSEWRRKYVEHRSRI